MEANNLYNTHQAGFRKNRSCLDQIMRLQNEVENAIHTRKFTVGVFLDFTKAYDMIWIEGLMLKILKLGIGGNMYRWIGDFLTNRTIQVRVGNALSGVKKMENGTPQGSSISPILFLLMINDLPEPTEGVSNAIFADDTALWKTGSDLETVIRQMQVNLTKVRKWCTSWGFKLSKDKTVAVIFTHRLVTDPTRLEIDGVRLQWKNEARFLGVIFDHRMTWKQHVQHIIDRCKPRTQHDEVHQRAVMGSGQAMADPHLPGHDPVDHRLRSTGLRQRQPSPPRSTRCHPVQRPPHLLRCHEGDAHVCPPGRMWGSATGSQARKPPAPVWNQGQGHCKSSIQENFGEAKGETWNTLIPSTNGDLPPSKPASSPGTSHTRNPTVEKGKGTVDLSLAEIKKNTPDDMLQQATMKINSFIDHQLVYTDASIKDGQVGAAYYIQDGGIGVKFRLSTGITIFTAEMIAIRESLKIIMENNTHRSVIFSDSLGSIQAIQSEQSTSRPSLLIEILELISDIRNLDNEITICWIPSHIGLPGNEVVDSLAKAAIDSPDVDMVVPYELREAYSVIDRHIRSKWQESWNNERTGRHYHSIVPVVSNGSSIPPPSGKKIL